MPMSNGRSMWRTGAIVDDLVEEHVKSTARQRRVARHIHSGALRDRR
jgi:hypothetical protein